MHLEIIQPTDRSETVALSVIEKLYSLAYSSATVTSPLDNTSVVQGNIRLAKAYRDSVSYLAGYVNDQVNASGKFPDLHVSITDSFYVRFDNEGFKNALVDSGLGDGVGVTEYEVAQISSVETTFLDRLDFNLTDLRYLTKPNVNFNNFLYYNSGTSLNNMGIYEGTWSNPSNIITLDLKFSGLPINLTYHFFGCPGKYRFVIRSIDWNGTTIIKGNNNDGLFMRCYFPNGWDDSIVPPQTQFSYPLFLTCQIGKVIFREGIIATNDNFHGCDVSYVEYPSTITDVGMFMAGFRRDSLNFGISNGTGCVVIKATTPPTTSGTINFSVCKMPAHIYVPDSSLTAYRNAGGQWADLSQYLAPISQMTDAEVAMGTITNKYAWVE